MRPLTPADLPWADVLLERELGGRLQARLGVLVDALDGPGIVAEDENGRPVGLLSWAVSGSGSEPDEAEIRVLVVEPDRRRSGIGSRLLEEAEETLRATAVRAAWLITTNDNIEALAFYQRRGWRLTALHPGAADVARATLKPAIPTVAADGIPIRDELVLAKDLQPA